MVKTRRWLTLTLLVAAAGCGTDPACRSALYRYGVSGKDIIKDIPAPTTDGARARLEAFTEACDEAIKQGQK